MKQAIQILEFNKIKQTVDSLCACSLGQKRVEYLSPSIDEKQVEYSLNQSDEALKIILALGEAPLGGVTDITEAIKRAKISAMLSAQELLGISRLLYAVSQLKTFSERLNEIKVDAPIFSSQVNSLVSLNSLQTAINDCIDETGYILDSASSELRNIRRSIQSTEARIKEKLNHVVSERRNKLTDGIVTIRNERYVVPVRAEAKNTFGGTVHDQSSSGNTYFIEPKEVVDLNNKLQEYHVEERREIERILRALTEEVKKFVDALAVNVEVLGEIDFMFAKGKYARLINGTRPKMNTKGIIRLVAARHPLIDQKVVVPNDIELGDEYTTIVITGPNTGGKTVTLKTVGLLTLMAQAGLLIPAHETSQLAIFDHVFADIGDEQSIEQSLSTFSSHMVNTVSILEQADENSLALFDELGAGTDPTEGAALATAILANLHKRHTLTMATTHYSELKLYALQTPDVENACCEFDVSTLRPTYRLLIGVPGKSNAFAISHKLGLSDDIIEDAKHHVASDATQFEDVLADLEQTRIRLEKELADASESRKEISRLRKELREKNDKIDNSKERILQNANEEAGRILAKAKDYADETIRKYTKWAESDAHIREMEAERTKLREQINSKQSHSLKPAKPKKASGLKAKDLFIGADVRILSLNSAGTVSTLPNDKGDLFVQAGLLRTKVNIRDLELIKQPKPEKNKPKNTGSGRIGMSKAATMHQEVNLIGMTVDQAMPVMEKYLDDAYLAHMTQVTVIHGRGTGALRTAVHNRLKKLKYVKSYRLGEFGEGDMGVTIVTFKS